MTNRLVRVVRGFAASCAVVAFACDGAESDGLDFGIDPGPTFLETDDINETESFRSVSFVCDGEASLLDWLVVFEVESAPDVTYIDAQVFQRGSGFGAIALDETRSGEWYADIWEDEYGIDCERDTQGVTFYAEDADGNVEILNL